MKANTRLEKLINYMLRADQTMRLKLSDEDAILAADRLHHAITVTVLSGSYHRLSPKSLYALAMILHHTGTARELDKAQKLAEKATTKQYPNGRWLWAAIYDRRRIMQGRPQKYGTQFVKSKKTGKLELKPIDNSCSDEERASMGLPTLHNVYKSFK